MGRNGVPGEYGPKVKLVCCCVHAIDFLTVSLGHQRT